MYIYIYTHVSIHKYSYLRKHKYKKTIHTCIYIYIYGGELRSALLVGRSRSSGESVALKGLRFRGVFLLGPGLWQQGLVILLII